MRGTLQESKKMNNPIRKLIQAKIKGLYAKYEESNSIQHNGTKGQLREQALSEFISDLLPNKYLVKSGFICDSKKEEISPQLDLIIADKDSMPNFTLNESSSIIPVESALAITEIKSTIMPETLEQLQRQRQVVNNMEFDYLFMVPVNPNIELPKISIASFLLAFDSKVRKEDLKGWFEQEPNLLSICVIGKYCWARLNEPHGITLIENKGEYEETRFFVGKQYAALNQLQKIRTLFEPNWDSYLQDIIPTQTQTKIKVEKTD